MARPIGDFEIGYRVLAIVFRGEWRRIAAAIAQKVETPDVALKVSGVGVVSHAVSVVIGKLRRRKAVGNAVYAFNLKAFEEGAFHCIDDEQSRLAVGVVGAFVAVTKYDGPGSGVQARNRRLGEAIAHLHSCVSRQAAVIEFP